MEELGLPLNLFSEKHSDDEGHQMNKGEREGLEVNMCVRAADIWREYTVSLDSRRNSLGKAKSCKLWRLLKLRHKSQGVKKQVTGSHSRY